MLATILHGMQGTPYIFQGEELGMTNIKLDISQYVDVEILNLYKERTAAGYSHESVMDSIYARGRDNARTPMQWTAEKNAGFTDGTPWLKVNPNYTEINVADQERDPDSVLNFYRKAIALRKSLSCVRYGTYREHRKLSGKFYLYSMQDDRQKILVVCSFSKKQERWTAPKEFCLDTAQLILGNYTNPNATILQPYECRVYLWK
jgi:glucan 1,6-alpha-glucosidase